MQLIKTVKRAVRYARARVNLWLLEQDYEDTKGALRRAKAEVEGLRIVEARLAIKVELQRRAVAHLATHPSGEQHGT